MAIMNYAIINMVMQNFSSLLSVLWGIYPEVELQCHMIIPCLNLGIAIKSDHFLST